MQRASVDSALTQAYRYRDRLTEHERQMAIAAYFNLGPGHDRQKAADAYHAILAVDPTDMAALNNLAIIEEQRRQYAAAESLFRRAIATGEAGALTLGNVIRPELAQGDTAAARRDAALLRQQYPNSNGAPFVGMGRYYAANQMDSLDAILRKARNDPRPDRRATAGYAAANVAIVRGQPTQWAALQAEARRADASRGGIAPPFRDSVTAAWLDVALRGEPARGVARLDALLAHQPLRTAPPEDRPYFDIAGVYAAAGRPDRARAILTQYDAEVTDSALRRNLEPERHRALGEIALAERRPTDALREFARADTAADGFPVSCSYCYALGAGRAYDQAGKADSAILLLERYEGTWLRVGNWPAIDPFYRALVYKRLGELYENKGDLTRAATNYRQFIALWQDADKELQPVVADARRRLAKLGAEAKTTAVTR
jgi:tetratricopeptide (TPR) repeat protein